MSEALNPQAFSKGTTISYPYFLAEKPDESFQLICRNLEEGEYPLCLYYQEKTFKIMSISTSAYNVRKLVNAVKLSIVTAGGKFEIKTVDDYLKGVQLWI